MEKSGFLSQKITTNFKQTIENVTSLTLSNYGDKEFTVIVGDVPRTVPAFNAEIGVPFGAFNLPGDGTACTITVEVIFENGAGDAILDYRKLKNC